jgi:hypothetical protein
MHHYGKVREAFYSAYTYGFMESLCVGQMADSYPSKHSTSLQLRLDIRVSHIALS